MLCGRVPLSQRPTPTTCASVRARTLLRAPYRDRTAASQKLAAGQSGDPPPVNGKAEPRPASAEDKSDDEDKPKAPKKDRVESAEESRKQASSTAKVELTLGQKFRNSIDVFAYQYFLWRQSTWNDLQLILGLNFIMLIVGVLLKTSFVDNLDARMEGRAAEPLSATALLSNAYGILQIVFAQQLPESNDSLVQQLFGLAVAAVGLASFALVIALVEQLVLQILDANVKQGSAVHEQGHVLVLGWVSNRKDEEVIWKILSQVCLAFRSEGGVRVVIMCQRPKLAMEDLFNQAIPVNVRYGTSFVFRQGSPTLPGDLRRVAAAQAKVTLIVSDSSRAAEEADSQALRTAILLDELDRPEIGENDTRIGNIITELKVDESEQLLRYACSGRVLPLMTTRLNAQRCARLVQQPIVASVSDSVWNFASNSQTYVHRFPQFKGRRFGDVFRYFPEGIVLGLLNTHSGEASLNPPGERVINADDCLVMLRSTGLSAEDYLPSEAPVDVDIGDWASSTHAKALSDSVDRFPKLSGLLSGFSAKPRLADRKKPKRSKSRPRPRQGPSMYMLPSAWVSSASNAPLKLLICGYADHTFMTELVKALDGHLPPGSALTLFSQHVTPKLIGDLCEDADPRNIAVSHVRGNPLKAADLRDSLDMTQFRCAIVLLDQAWQDPDRDIADGVDERSQTSLLRLDSMLMRTHLNLRKLLEEAGEPDINIITEKVAFDSVTRFEDQQRLPLGISINAVAYGARMLTQAAFEPRMLEVLGLLGKQAEVTVQDAAVLAAEGEEVSFWQLQARALHLHQVLLGYLIIPDSMDKPVEMQINPEGLEDRAKPQVWNKGDKRTRLISLAPPGDCQVGGGPDAAHAEDGSEAVFVSRSSDQAGASTPGGKVGSSSGGSEAKGKPVPVGAAVSSGDFEVPASGRSHPPPRHR